MGEQSIILPVDSVGKAVHTRERTVSGPGTVQEQYVINQSRRVPTGDYYAHSGVLTVLASAHSTTTGFVVLVNRSAAQMVAIKRVTYMEQFSAATVFPTLPRITLERCTFTDTPSAGLVTPAKRIRTTQNGETADATNVAEFRTALTGLTLTAGETFGSFMVTIVQQAVSANVTPVAPAIQVWGPWDESDQIILANNEGMVIRQADAGTTSDTRKFTLDVSWQEYTVP